MFLFRDSSAKPAEMVPQAATVVGGSVGKKSRKKKRNNKKKSKSNSKGDETGDEISVVSSEDEMEVDVSKEIEHSREESVGTGGSHVDVMIHNIAENLKIDMEEVKHCVHWMWDRGLKYDNEQDVEKELKKKTYASTNPEDDTANRTSEATVESKQQEVEVEEETDAEQLVYIAQKEVKERLQVVANYAMTNLHDSLVALCSWAAIQRTKSANVAEIFFDSDILRILYACILSNPQEWQSSSPNVRSVLINLFTELTNSRDFATWIADALDRCFARLGSHHTQFSASSIENKSVIEGIANQLAQVTYQFWHDVPATVSPESVRDATNDLSKFAKSTNVKSWLESTSELFLAQQQEQFSTVNNLNDRQVHLKAKIQELADLTFQQMEAMKSINVSMKISLSKIPTPTVTHDHNVEQPSTTVSHHNHEAAQPMNQTEDYDAQFEHVTEEKKAIAVKIEALIHHREELLEQIRRCDMEVAELNKEMGSVNRKLFMIDRNRKTAMLNKGAIKSASNGKNTASSNKSTPTTSSLWNSPATPQVNKVVDTAKVDTTIGEGFVDDLFTVSQYNKRLNDCVEQAINEFKTLMVEECNSISACAQAIHSKRKKKEEFRRQRGVYEGLNLHKLVVQIDKEDHLIEEQMTVLSSYIDSALEALQSLLRSVRQELVAHFPTCLSPEIIGTMMQDVESLGCSIPDMMKYHIWTKEAWNNRKQLAIAGATAGSNSNKEITNKTFSSPSKVTTKDSSPQKTIQVEISNAWNKTASASATTETKEANLDTSHNGKQTSKESASKELVKTNIDSSSNKPRSISASRSRPGTNSNTPGNKKGGKNDKKNTPNKKENNQDTLSVIANLEKQSAFKK